MINKKYVLWGTYIYFINYFIWKEWYNLININEINNLVYNPISYISILGRFLGFALIFKGIAKITNQWIYTKAFYHQFFTGIWYLLNLTFELTDTALDTGTLLDDLFKTTIVLRINNLILFVCLIYYLLRRNHLDNGF